LVFDALFEQDGDVIRVRNWIRRDIQWVVADAMDPNLRSLLGSADFVLANNFLGMMPDDSAEKCMDNLLNLVTSGGYLILNGDLDVKPHFAKRHRLTPVSDRIEAIHFGDRSKLRWPWSRFGSEPIDKTCVDWPIRYAQIYCKHLDSI
jgi:chemotaxis protein methyltransferase CheR